MPNRPTAPSPLHRNPVASGAAPTTRPDVRTHRPGSAGPGRWTDPVEPVEDASVGGPRHRVRAGGRTRASARRLAGALALVGLLGAGTTACSDDDASPAPTTTEPGGDGTADGGDGDGTTDGGPEEPAAVVAARALDVGGLAGSGSAGQVNDLAAVGDLRVAVGSVQDLGAGTREPLVVVRGTGAWERATVEPVDGTTSATAASVTPGVDGTPVVFGSATSGEDASVDGDVVAWRRGATAWTPVDLTGDLVGDGDQAAGRAAAGPAGAIVAGTADGELAVWTSADGTDFTRIDFTDALGATPLDQVTDVAVGTDRMVITGRTATDTVVLATADGTTFEALHEASRKEEQHLHAVAWKDGFVIGGGVGADAVPTVWRTDGATWPEPTELPAPEGATSNNGFPVRALDAGPEQLVVTYAYSLAVSRDAEGWEPIPYRGLEPGAEVELVAAGPGSTFAEAVQEGRELWTLEGTEWTETGGNAVPAAERTVSPEGIAHRDGTWVVAATVRDGGGEPRTVVWTAGADGEWEEAAPLPGAEEAYATVVSATPDGFVVAGVVTEPDLAKVWTSPDGRTWTAVDAPELTPPEGGVHQPEAAFVQGGRTIIAGFGFDGSDIQPLVLSLAEGRLTRLAVPPVGDRPDSISVDGCVVDGSPWIVGGSQDERSYLAWWRGSSAGFTPSSTDLAGGIQACIQAEDRVIGAWSLGEAPPGLVTIPLDGAPAEAAAESLDAGPIDEVVSIVPLGERLVVIGHTAGAGNDGRLWVSDEGATAPAPAWTVVRDDVLGGPDAQRATGAASDGDRLIVTLRDGASSRLVEVRAAG